MASIPAGAPLDAFAEVETVDLNTLVSLHCPDPVLLRLDGMSMFPEIGDNDLVLISRSLPPRPGDIVLAYLNGGYTIKRFEVRDRRERPRLYLVPSNESMKPREVTEEDEFEIYGVVTWVFQNKRRT